MISVVSWCFFPILVHFCDGRANARNSRGARHGHFPVLRHPLDVNRGLVLSGGLILSVLVQRIVGLYALVPTVPIVAKVLSITAGRSAEIRAGVRHNPSAGWARAGGVDGSTAAGCMVAGSETGSETGSEPMVSGLDNSPIHHTCVSDTRCVALINAAKLYGDRFPS